MAEVLAIGTKICEPVGGIAGLTGSSAGGASAASAGMAMPNATTSAPIASYTGAASSYRLSGLESVVTVVGLVGLWAVMI